MHQKIQCIIVDDEPVARDILESHLTKIDNIIVAEKCKNALEAFSAINSKAIDLIFLDIQMPEISGLSFAKSINSEVKIIFTTAYREYAVDGFDLRAVDYLLKPISFDRLLQAVHKYIDETMPVKIDIDNKVKPQQNNFIFVRSDRKMIKVDFSDILYIESLSDYIKIHLKAKSIVTREAISSIEAKLPQKDFIRVHRSFIVSISKIDSFTSDFIELHTSEIPISRSYKNQVLKKLGNG